MQIPFYDITFKTQETECKAYILFKAFAETSILGNSWKIAAFCNICVLITLVSSCNRAHERF